MSEPITMHEVTCIYCGEVWYQVSEPTYTCCMPCWRKIRKRNTRDCEPCRVDGKERCEDESPEDD